MNKIISGSLLCVLSVLFLGTDVRAEDAGLCTEDVTKFCKGIRFGGGRISTCLNEHANELSPGCSRQQGRMSRRVFQECQDDAAKFCSTVRPEDRRIIRCLLRNETELSIECREMLRETKTQQAP